MMTNHIRNILVDKIEEYKIIEKESRAIRTLVQISIDITDFDSEKERGDFIESVRYFFPNEPSFILDFIRLDDRFVNKYNNLKLFKRNEYDMIDTPEKLLDAMAIYISRELETQILVINVVTQ